MGIRGSDYRQSGAALGSTTLHVVPDVFDICKESGFGGRDSGVGFRESGSGRKVLGLG